MVDTVVIGILGISFLLMYFSNNLDNEHYVLKTFISLFTIITISFIPFYLTTIADVDQTTVVGYYKIYVYFIYMFSAYVVIYFIYFIFQKMRDWFVK